MLGLLRRHEVKILLKAGHKQTEVARLTGVSRSSVQRIAEEASIEHFDDTAERRNRRIGRPSIVGGLRKTISGILEKQPDLPSVDILRQVQNAGYTGGKTGLYALVASLRSIELATNRNEAFEWMRAVQQGTIPRSTLEEQLGHVTELNKLLVGIRNGPWPQRKKAMAVLDVGVSSSPLQSERIHSGKAKICQCRMTCAMHACVPRQVQHAPHPFLLLDQRES